MEHILDRTWYWIVDDVGWHISPPYGRDFEGKTSSPDEMPKISSIPWIPGNIPKETSHIEIPLGPKKGDLKLPAVCIRLDQSGRFADIAETWLRHSFRLQLRPCTFFSRQRLEQTRLYGILSTSCADQTFLSDKCEGTPQYRNREKAVQFLKLPSSPKTDQIRFAWNVWADGQNILAGSTRMLAIRNGEDLAVHSTGLDPAQSEKMRSCGLKWDQGNKTWQGQVGVVDLDALIRLIRLDSLPGPELLGYVPEWYCDMISRYPETQRGKEGEEAGLWDLLFE